VLEIDPEKANELLRRTELERKRTLGVAWQAEATRLRTALEEILRVVNSQKENTAGECHIREIVTLTIYGKSDKITLG